MITILQFYFLSQGSFLDLIPDLPIVALFEEVVSQLLLLCIGHLNGWLLDFHFFKGGSY